MIPVWYYTMLGVTDLGEGKELLASHFMIECSFIVRPPRVRASHCALHAAHPWPPWLPSFTLFTSQPPSLFLGCPLFLWSEALGLGKPAAPLARDLFVLQPLLFQISRCEASAVARGHPRSWDLSAQTEYYAFAPSWGQHPPHPNTGSN